MTELSENNKGVRVSDLQDLMRAVRQGEPIKKINGGEFLDLYKTFENGPDEKGKCYPNGVGIFRGVISYFEGSDGQNIAKEPQNLTTTNLTHYNNEHGNMVIPLILKRKGRKEIYRHGEKTTEEELQFALLTITDGKMNIDGDFSLKELKREKNVQKVQ